MGAALEINEVLFYGMVQSWSSANPKMGLKYGDRIVQVNGVHGNGKAIEIELKKHQVLKITINRIDYELGDSVEGYFHLCEWRPATISGVNADGTYTVIWA